MSAKPECCEKYRRKNKVCKKCPLMEGLTKKRRRKLLKKLRKRLADGP